MGLLDIFGFGGNKIKDALRRGAVIIDVRTAHEFDQGKIKGSINIPVDRIDINLERIRQMKKPVITCCSSGTRSADAAHYLRSRGISEVHNGGSWQSVLRKIQSL